MDGPNWRVLNWQQHKSDLTVQTSGVTVNIDSIK